MTHAFFASLLLLATAAGCSSSSDARPAPDAGADALSSDAAETADADAAVGTLHVGATDTLDLEAASNFANLPCMIEARTHYHVDFAAKTLHLDATGLCGEDGGAPPTTTKDVALTAQQASDLLAAANAMQLETASLCGADGAGEGVTVAHADADASSETYPVDNLGTCWKGQATVRAADFKAIWTKLNAISGYVDPVAN